MKHTEEPLQNHKNLIAAPKGGKKRSHQDFIIIFVGLIEVRLMHDIRQLHKPLRNVSRVVGCFLFFTVRHWCTAVFQVTELHPTDLMDQSAGIG